MPAQSALATEVAKQRKWIAAGVLVVVALCVHALYELHHDSKNGFATVMSAARARTSCNKTKSALNPSASESYEFVGGGVVLALGFLFLRYAHHDKVTDALSNSSRGSDTTAGSDAPPGVSPTPASPVHPAPQSPSAPPAHLVPQSPSAPASHLVPRGPSAPASHPAPPVATALTAASHPAPPVATALTAAPHNSPTRSR